MLMQESSAHLLAASARICQGMCSLICLNVCISNSEKLVYVPVFACPPLTGNTAPSLLEFHPSFSGRAQWICTVHRSCSYPGGNYMRKKSLQSLRQSVTTLHMIVLFLY